MDRATLVNAIQTCRFGTVRTRQSYAVEGVDDFLDALVGQVQAGASPEQIRASINGAQFSLVQFQAGYDPQQVDDFLDSLVLDEGATASPAASGSTRDASAAAVGTSAIIEPEKGLLSRLFGR